MSALPPLAAIFPDACVVNVDDCTDKTAVMKRLLATLSQAGRLGSSAIPPMQRELIRRERFLNTAFGHGIAIPHLRSKLTTDFIGAIGVSASGKDFNSLDQKPTHIIMLVVSPFEQRAAHLDLISRLVSIMHDASVRLCIERGITTEDVIRRLGDIDACDCQDRSASSTNSNEAPVRKSQL